MAKVEVVKKEDQSKKKKIHYKSKKEVENLVQPINFKQEKVIITFYVESSFSSSSTTKKTKEQKPQRQVGILSDENNNSNNNNCPFLPVLVKGNSGYDRKAQLLAYAQQLRSSSILESKSQEPHGCHKPKSTKYSNLKLSWMRLRPPRRNDSSSVQLEENGRFVPQNYERLKKEKSFSESTTTGFRKTTKQQQHQQHQQQEQKAYSDHHSL